MAMLPAYSPMSTMKPLSNNKDSSPLTTTYGDPGLDPKNQFHIRNTPTRSARGDYGSRDKQPGLPQITPPGELMYDTGQGYVPLYQDVGLGGGAQGTFRNLSTSGRAIYDPTGGIQDFSRVAVQSNPGSLIPRYSPYYSMSETGQPQVVAGIQGAVPYQSMSQPVYRNASPTGLSGVADPDNPGQFLQAPQANASGQNLQDYFFNMMVNRLVPGYGEGSGGGGLNWEAMFSQLQNLTNPSDPDSIETLRRLFGLT